LIAVAIGYLLLTIALHRARFVPLWVPLVVAAGVLFATVTDSVDSKLVPVTTWTLVLITFGYVGLRILTMSDKAWAARLPDSDREARPSAEPAAVH
jgi:hypothetical protein